MPRALTDADTADVDLVSAAHGGDASALGTLLLRHRPGMLAVAVSLLGYGPDAEDAVQEASYIAQACGVPVGTVRSRLNEARGKLAHHLLKSADAAHGGVATVTAQRANADHARSTSGPGRRVSDVFQITFATSN